MQDLTGITLQDAEDLRKQLSGFDSDTPPLLYRRKNRPSNPVERDTSMIRHMFNLMPVFLHLHRKTGYCIKGVDLSNEEDPFKRHNELVRSFALTSNDIKPGGPLLRRWAQMKKYMKVTSEAPTVTGTPS